MMLLWLLTVPWAQSLSLPAFKWLLLHLIVSKQSPTSLGKADIRTRTVVIQEMSWKVWRPPPRLSGFTFTLLDALQS